ncbi:MAG: RHS repeat-associated core domain-containing protein, partial [Opitutales bacterium]|nr:RHS repeat-associated core domain-containing protein [Opitutales bacterium]
AGTTVSWERYLYRDYLQVAAFDITESAGTLNYSLKRVIYWDPSEPVATRPLIINIVGDQLYFPTVDLTKNVCELVTLSGTLAATYDYSPFGAVTSTGTVANPLQWSSEIYDSELALVYYNYRHYSPYDGRWLSRDPIEELGGWNLYAFVGNQILHQTDWLGFKGRSGRPKPAPLFPGGVGRPINPLLPKAPPFADEIDGGFFREKNRLAIMLILRELILNGKRICEAGIRKKTAGNEKKCDTQKKGCCVITLYIIREFPARTNWWGEYIPGSGEVVSIEGINYSYHPHDCGFVQFAFDRPETVEPFFIKYPL